MYRARSGECLFTHAMKDICLANLGKYDEAVE